MPSEHGGAADTKDTCHEFISAARSRRARILPAGLDRLCDHGRMGRRTPWRSQRTHAPLPGSVDAPDLASRGPHGGYADHGGAAERHRVLRLHDPACARRRADHHAGDRRGGGAVIRATVQHRHLAGPVGGQDHRPHRHLHLRVLQVRLVVPAVQLCGNHARRHAVRERTGHARSRTPRPAHHAAVRGGGAEFQPRPARLLLRARLPRLVRRRLGVDRIDHRRGHRDLAAPVRLGGPARPHVRARNRGTAVRDPETTPNSAH